MAQPFVKALTLVLLISPSVVFAQATVQTTIEMGLNLPLKNRVEVIRKTGGIGFYALEKIIFDNKQSLQKRWRALTTISLTYGTKAEPIIKKASQSNLWYLRNAAVISAKYCDRFFAIQLAEKLLLDKALVVRAAAVETLRVLGAKKSKKLLWRQLYSQKNFRKKQSLWVRHNIVKTLVEFSNVGDESVFLSLLDDTDIRVQKQAIKGLEKLVGVKISKRKPLKTKIIAWKNFFQNRYQ